MNLKSKKGFVLDDVILPEETLLDSQSDYSDIERPISSTVFRVFFAGMAVLCVSIFISVFRLSVVNGEHYATLASDNKSVLFPLPPPRGIILDFQGKPLVKNNPRFDLLVFSRELRGLSENDQSFSKVAEILSLNAAEFNLKVLEEMKDSSLFYIATNLTKDQVLKIQQLNPKGFYVTIGSERSYVNGSEFSHVLGYLGKVNPQDLKDTYYTLSDTIGRQGIESEYETQLRGEHGKLFFDTQVEQETQQTILAEPQVGNNLVLNIDYELQRQVYKAVSDVLRESGLSRAAAVVQDPRSGEVRAMVSFPSFDNNVFNNAISETDYKNLFESKLKPLFNRVISGTYNPGSTIKPLMGLMGLEENVMDPSDVINNDCVSLVVPNPFNPDQPAIFKNWRADTGPFSLRRAIADSCNVYFFTIGGGFGDVKGLGITRIANYLKKSFADLKLGIDLPNETQGFVPTPEWKKRERGEQWYLGDTYNVSIGQGDLSVSPLWLNTYIGAIANGGTIFKPQVVNKIVDKDNHVIQSFDKQIIGELPFKYEHIKEMKEAMKETVTSGTGQVLKDIPVSIAAKSGTAEVLKGQTINSFFTSFAPADSPEMVMTVLFEGATNQQGLAIRATNAIYRWYFGERASGSQQ